MLPAHLACDHRAAQTPVQSQGTRKTCASFTTTAAHEWMAGNSPSLSEEDAVWAAEQHAPTGKEAAFVRDVLAGISTHGHALAEDWPYGQPLFHQGRPPAAQDPARQRRCGGYTHSPSASVEALGELLIQGLAPIVTVRFVAATWAAATGNGWVNDPDPQARGSHAVLIVGALAASATRPEAIVFKNSWHERWGDDGFGYMTDRYLQVHHRYTDVLEPSP